MVEDRRMSHERSATNLVAPNTGAPMIAEGAMIGNAKQTLSQSRLNTLRSSDSAS